MTERAWAGPTDGVVQFELSLDLRHEIEDVVACMRAGAVAWSAIRPAGTVDQALRLKNIQHVLDVAQEIEDEARRVHDRREEYYRAEAKREAKESRARARAQ